MVLFTVQFIWFLVLKFNAILSFTEVCVLPLDSSLSSWEYGMDGLANPHSMYAHTVFTQHKQLALFCFVLFVRYDVVISSFLWSIYPCSSRLLLWHWGKCRIVPLSAWLKGLLKGRDLITKQNKAKPCVSLSSYTIPYGQRFSSWHAVTLFKQPIRTIHLLYI